MKKLATLILLIVSKMILSMSLLADESILLDFSTLTAAQTTLDYSIYLPDSYQSAENTMSLDIINWQIVLNNSANSNARQQLSYVLPAPSKTLGTVLGARINFPEWNANSYADIVPPFEIPVFTEEGISFEGNGIITNVGDIKEIKVNVYGGNFPHRLILILEDQNYKQLLIPMGSLQFLGWKELVWENTVYIENPNNRALLQQPRYPTSSAFIKLIGFRIFRHGKEIGGDTIVYIKDVSITYDKSTLFEDEDFDEEELWGIISKKEKAINREEMEKLAIRMYLIEQEALKIHNTE